MTLWKRVSRAVAGAQRAKHGNADRVVRFRNQRPRNDFDYIETESPQNALLVDERIQTQVEILARFPESGRPGRINGTREFIVEHTPFIVTYLIQGDVVRILRVLHGAQQWPDAMSPS